MEAIRYDFTTEKYYGYVKITSTNKVIDAYLVKKWHIMGIKKSVRYQLTCMRGKNFTNKIRSRGVINTLLFYCDKS